eukprot:scaffold6086_cov116-Skeletonema_marinoi.AAC.5
MPLPRRRASTRASFTDGLKASSSAATTALRNDDEKAYTKQEQELNQTPVINTKTSLPRPPSSFAKLLAKAGLISSDKIDGCDSLRSISLTLYQRLPAATDDNSKRTSVNRRKIQIYDGDEEEERNVNTTTCEEDPNTDMPSERVLFEFMRLAGEAITYIEARELWNDMRSTNNGSLPRFRDMMIQSSSKSLRRLPSKALMRETALTFCATSQHTTTAASADSVNSTLRQDDTPNDVDNETRPKIDQLLSKCLSLSGADCHSVYCI